MSLVTHLIFGTPKGDAPTRQEPAAYLFLGRLRNALATALRYFVRAMEAIAEARVQKAIIEAELYRNRYLHSSKNDDDLPVVR